MARVEGLGGVFFKADDPEALYAWYETHLGIARGDQGAPVFHWREVAEPDRRGMTVGALFPAATAYFAPSTKPFMLNYRVKNLDEVLVALRAEGVAVDDKVEDYLTAGSAGLPIPKETGSSCGNREILPLPPSNAF